MSELPPGFLVGREAELERFKALLRPSASDGASYLWVIGQAGSGKSRFLDVCVERAAEAGWETLQGSCSEETRTDPYGPFLSTLGLCFDRSGRLINDRSVYTIVDQISLDDVFDAVNDIPGMAVVAFGIKVGMSIFEARRRPRSSDELLNRNFEFILQVLEQISQKRKKPLLLALDDLHLASATTYALLEYLLTRIKDTRLLIVATWSADSAEEGEVLVRERLPLLAQSDRLLYLRPLSDAYMHQLLRHLNPHLSAKPPAATLVRLSRGLPGVLAESLRLVELEGEACLSAAAEWTTSDSALRALITRQVNRLGAEERAILECASLIGQRVPLAVLGAPPLCAYLGLSERALLARVVELADRAGVLTWEGDEVVRFVSPSVRRFLHERVHKTVARRDHLRIAEAWQSIGDDAHPAQLAAHYLAGGEPQKALEFALQSAEELGRRAAYPEAIQSYRLALEALKQMDEEADSSERECGILLAMGLVAEQAGDWEQALVALKEALSLAEDDARKAEIHAGLGWLHVQRGEMQAARDHLRRSASLYEALGDASGRAQVDYYLGVLYRQQKEWRRAIDCFERYLEVSHRAGFSEGRASAYVELGNLHRLQRRWEQAEQLLRRGIELARQDEDYAVLAQGYHYLGVLYGWQGRPEAVEMLHRALDIVRTRTKQPAQEARIQNTLAETLVRMNRWAEAEAAFHASAAIKERLGDRAGLAMTYGGLGRLYLRRWVFDLAAEYLQKDIELLNKEFTANVAWIQQLTNTLGEVYRRQGNLEQAAECLERALELAASIPDPEVRERSRGYTHMLRANLAIDRGDLDAAERECARALELLGGTWAAGEVNRTAARLARVRGDLERARQHLERALSAARHGEDIDRALVGLEWAYLCRDAGDREGMRKWAEQVLSLAHRLENVGLQRLAGQLLDGGLKSATGAQMEAFTSHP